MIRYIKYILNNAEIPKYQTEHRLVVCAVNTSIGNKAQC